MRRTKSYSRSTDREESPPKRRSSNAAAAVAVNHGLSVEAMLRGEEGATPMGEHHGGSMHVYMAHKISKLGEQGKLEGTDVLSNIFKGCFVFVNGHTTPPVNEIKRAVLTHGGHFNQYETSNTTHFVCNHFPQTKLDRLKKGLEKRQIFYVTAEWVTECIRQGKRLNETNFRPTGLYVDNTTRRVDAMLGSDSSSASNAARPSVLSSNENQSRDSSSSSSGAQRSSTTSTTGGAGSSPQNSGENNSPEYFEAVDAMGQFPFELYGDAGEEGEQMMVEEGLSLAPTSASSGVVTSPTARHPGVRNAAEMDKSAQSDPNFINRFYENSRLHFIGTWRARLPQLFEECTADHDAAVALMGLASDSARALGDEEACLSPSSRVVLHVDMDCFFVSALLRTRPELRNRPVAVSHGNAATTHGYSEISSCNYPARQYKLKNGMFLSEALKLCPHLMILPYDFELYRTVSEQVYRIFFQCGAKVQPVSVDESYLEFPPGTDGRQAAAEIRRRIFETTQCPASVGIGYNMITARLATKKAKPDGIFVLTESTAWDFLSSLPVEDVPGIGRKHAAVLHAKGCLTCGDIWGASKAQLQQWIGDSLGATLFDYSRGIDNRQLASVQPRKSIGLDINYGIRFTSLRALEDFFLRMAQELEKRILQANRKGGKMLTLKLLKRKLSARSVSAKFMGHGQCDAFSRSMTSTTNMCTAAEIHAAAVGLLRRLIGEWSSVYKADAEGISLGDIVAQELRGIGIHISKLVDKTSSSSEGVGISRLFKKRPIEGEENVASPDSKQVSDTHTSAPPSQRARLEASPPIAVVRSAVTPQKPKPHELSVHGQLIRNQRLLSFKSSESNALSRTPPGTRPDDFVTQSQLDFLVSVPPELMSQAMTNIREANKQQRGAETSDKNDPQKPLTSQPASLSKPTAVRNIASSHVNVAGPKKQRVVHSVWEREPLTRIAQALRIWATIGPRIHAKVVVGAYRHESGEGEEDDIDDDGSHGSTTNSSNSCLRASQEELELVERDAVEAFPTDGHIRLLRNYASNLVATKQADRAVVFFRMVERTFAGLPERFQFAVSSTREAIQLSAKKHMRGQQLAL